MQARASALASREWRHPVYDEHVDDLFGMCEATLMAVPGYLWEGQAAKMAGILDHTGKNEASINFAGN